MLQKSKVTVAALLCSSALVGAAPLMAQSTTAAAAPEDVDVLIVTGTRSVATKAADSAAPIQVLGADELKRVGQPNLNQALTQLVPSFTAQTQGTDMASFSLSARLRGVSPNQTLLLVNGKRRHGNSIVQVINGAFGGSAAPSIDLIPPDSVQRIEILQDGAAAQYGSDAIAGVINIILKNNPAGVSARANLGQYYDGEGFTYSGSANIGLPVGDNGFLNVTLFQRTNDFTRIGGDQATVRNYNGSTVNNISAAFRPIYDALNARNGSANLTGGQPKSSLYIGSYNFGYDFGGAELYSFGNVSYRTGDALQGYRPPNRVCADTANPATCLQTVVNTGFIPSIQVRQDEFSFTGGVRGETSGWNWDLSGTYGSDLANVFTGRSINASMWITSFNNARNAFRLANPTFTANSPEAIAAGQRGAFSPTEFFDGSFKFTQFVATADIRKEFDIGFAEPLTFAFGGEYRKETYRILPGDAGSLFIEGGQSFPGFSQSDSGTTERNAIGAYVNVIAKPADNWLVDVAGRVEDYSDFGSTVIGRLTTRYDFSPAFALRGTVSTGFRAPTLAESGYSATNVGPTAATLQLAPSSPGSAAAGFGALGPEKSTNFSAGFVWRPVPRLIVTMDAYQISIRDRIVSSGTITGQDSQPFPTPGVPRTNLINGITAFQLVTSAIAASGKSLDPTVLQSGSLALQTFTNGIDTRTRGIELAARYPVELAFGNLNLSLGANFNDTKVTRSNLGGLFTLGAEAIIERTSPRFKTILGMLFTSGDFAANVRATHYSESATFVQPNVFSTTPRPITGDATPGWYKAVVEPTVIADLELAYNVTKFLNIAVGANNLFNKIPEVPPLVADYNVTAPAAGWQAGNRSPYINNQGARDAPYTFGPYGTNGGYYYLRLSVDF